MSDGIKLHIGCGDVCFEGWKHLDIVEYPHVDYVRQAHETELPSDSCDMIYASHVLEYYDWQMAVRAVLPEWSRILKPKGTLMVSVPDWKKMINAYQMAVNNWPLAKLIGPLFGRSYGRYHRAVYDFETLSSFLSVNGFRRITEVDKFDIPSTDCSNSLISLNVIAERL